MLLNCVLEKTLESPLDCKEIQWVNPKGNKSWIFIVRTDTLSTWCEQLTPWRRPWCWARLKAGREGDDREWDGWMALPTRWMWVWASSGSWWWTGKPGMLQSMGSQKVRYDWTTELNWKWKQWQILYSWALKSLLIMTAATKLRDTCFLEEKL